MDAYTIQREACVLPRSTTAPALARGFVSSTLTSWAVRDTFADVPLLASELVTNAVRHANGDVALSLAARRPPHAVSRLVTTPMRCR